MDDGRFRLIRALYKKEELFGFAVHDIITALIFSIAGWLFLSILPLIAGIIIILAFRNFRMNRPRGYFMHLLYHYGYYNPAGSIPPGYGINKILFE